MSLEMNNTIREEIRLRRRINRPWSIAFGLFFGISAILIDGYLPFAMRAAAQEATWSICSLGIFFVFIRKFLMRKRLLISFAFTLAIQGCLVYSTRFLFPLSNSLILIIFFVPGIFILGISFAIFSRLLDPHGPRPE